MRNRALVHLQVLFWGLLGLTLIGLAIDAVSWVLVIGLASYLAWTIRQILRLYNWLNKSDPAADIPESHGLWGELFESLYRVHQENARAQDRLQSMIFRVRSSTNALKDGVIMTNSEGELDWWNQAANNLLGLRYEQDRGQLLTNLVRDPAFKVYFDDKQYSDALELSSPLDRNLVLRIHITLFGHNDRLILIQNVTRIHHLEQMRRDFVSNVSHEMRTPLTVIRGYIETLEDTPDSPPKWKRPLKAMAEQAQRLEVLISDLLLLEKYETGDHGANAKPVDLAKLMQMICHDAEHLVAETRHKVTLDCQIEGLILGDENQLRSAFSNLVFNAVKYTPDEGDIDVACWEDSRGIHVSVNDSGCGIDAVHIPRLTERFYRADASRHAKTGGSGLGLAIVKHVLINHHGELEIKSELNKGSEFICHFPNTLKVSDRSSDQVANAS